MTLSQLKAFCAVVDQGSFRAASRCVGIAQSAITQSVQGLESELGVPLLTRSYAGISMTSSGQKLLARARLILTETEHIERDVRALENVQEGFLSLAATSEPLVELIMPVLNRFRLDNPHIEISISSGSAAFLTERVRTGRLDLALCALPTQFADSGLDVERLYHSSAAIIARVGHPKANARSIKELADCMWVGMRQELFSVSAASRLMQIFSEHGLGEPAMAMIAETSLEKLYMVSETDYLTVEPRALTEASLFSGSLISIPVQEVFDPRDVCLIRRSNVPVNAEARSLSSMLVSYARLRQGWSGRTAVSRVAIS